MKKQKVVYISLLLIESTLSLFTDIYFMGHLILCTVVYGAAGALAVGLSGKKVQIQITTGSGRCRKGDEVEIAAEAGTGMIARLLCFRIRMEAENILTGQKQETQAEFSTFIDGRYRAQFGLCSPYCGQIEIRTKEITVSGCLGIFCMRSDACAGAEILVFPRGVETFPEIEEIEHYDMESYKYSSSRKGEDMSETFGIKAYEPGDSTRCIHWKLSAKTDELLVKELSLPVENRMMIIADKGSAEEQPDPEAADKITELIEALSRTAVSRGIKHKIGWYDCRAGQFEEYTIDSEDDILQVMPGLLSSPHRKDAVTAAERYLQHGADKDTAVYLYVTDSLTAEEDTGVLAEYGKVKICAIQKNK